MFGIQNDYLYYYTKKVIQRIIDKYNMNQVEALKAFLESEIYNMLKDMELEMWEFSEEAIFEMWEVEKITGDPRNSIYFRGE